MRYWMLEHLKEAVELMQGKVIFIPVQEFLKLYIS